MSRPDRNTLGECPVCRHWRPIDPQKGVCGYCKHRKDLRLRKCLYATTDHAALAIDHAIASATRQACHAATGSYATNLTRALREQGCTIRRIN